MANEELKITVLYSLDLAATKAIEEWCRNQGWLLEDPMIIICGGAESTDIKPQLITEAINEGRVIIVKRAYPPSNDDKIGGGIIRGTRILS